MWCFRRCSRQPRTSGRPSPGTRRGRRRRHGEEVMDDVLSSQRDVEIHPSAPEHQTATLRAELQEPDSQVHVHHIVEIPELKHASVRMRDGGRVETIIEHMRREGPNALQVISDFDMTLTRFAHNGTRCPTSYSILHSSAVISEDCKAKMSDLFDLYYPVEINTSMSVEEKIPHMEEWVLCVHLRAM
ncbi:7-methylguanosine phosphate-specific 5'-nucleotidase-like isoform X1 [Ictalurus furcatus]|uniref:7-methylguanosine phosphate-specific 5'-nucleotidase-like isoform X1 n=1 Tax=Ictalurus furcatus TaxID=66913 RepID=UPI00234FF739|nr:7-methylguanosine phosphate-specific 5'-nucleotidase-like isoform X1 [Ictalurus furcatus]